MIGAVDIGGTKTLVAVFDKAGVIIERNRFATPADYTDFLKELANSVANLSTNNFSQIVVAIPGKVNRKDGVGIAFGNLLWQEVPIKHDTEKIFHCPTRIENDANLAGLAEARALESQPAKVLYITISTGIGSGFIVHDRIDPDFADAEVGQMLFEYHDRLERWEDFASGKAMVAKFGKKASDITDEQTWYIIARNISIGLINLIATLTPDVVIIGGGVGNHLEKFKDRLLEELSIYQNPLLTIPPIIQAKHPEEAVVYGCFQFAKDHHA